MHIKSDISKHYNRVGRLDGALLTPEIVKLLRGLISLTPKRFSTLSSVKKNQLLKFEQGLSDLSQRNKQWMVAVFSAYDIDIFSAQGHTQITMSGEPIMENGVILATLHDAIDESSLRSKRHSFGLSQKQLARLSGLSQGKISVIERRNTTKFYPLSDVARLNCVLTLS